MNKYQLHYARIDKKLNEDIEVIEFKKHNHMIQFIDERCLTRSNKLVWLLSREDSTDVFISQNHISIQDFLQTKMLWQTVGTYFLQEYLSYEDAYAVALNIVEVSPLCYSEENKHKTF